MYVNIHLLNSYFHTRVPSLFIEGFMSKDEVDVREMVAVFCYKTIIYALVRPERTRIDN